MKYQPKTKPFPHQSRATLAAVRNRNYAVFFEPRLGKTKTALDYLAILALKGEVKRALIIAPRIALEVWASELEKHFPYFYHAETFTEEWNTTTRIFAADPPEVQFFLAGREETFRATRRAGKLERPKQDLLRLWRPDAIIIDESHEYKRPGGRGAQDAWRFVGRLRDARRQTNGGGEDSPHTRPYVLLLTGTPSAKGWRDLFAQFRIMDPSILGTNASSFDEEYCIYGQGPRKYTVIRYRNLPKLQAIIGAHSVSCTAEEAHLAGKLEFQILPTTLPQKVRRHYDELAEHFLTEVDGQLITASNAGVKRLRLLQLTSGHVGDKQLHRAKEQVAKDWLALLREQGEGVVVYCRFTAEVDAQERLANAVGYDVRVIDGRTTRSARADSLRWFQERRGTSNTHAPLALVLQYQAGGTSIELSAAAEVLFVSLPDGWVQFWQALNRVRGPNQNRPVRVTAICARGTVDMSVLYGLRNKEDIHRLLMRDPKRFLRGNYTNVIQ
jgi:hypothetical protein